jgi:hypothetical protein
VELAVAGLPTDYLVVQLVASPSSPDLDQRRAQASDLVKRLSHRFDVQLLSPDYWFVPPMVDLISDVEGPRIHRVRSTKVQADLSAQALLLAGCHGFVGSAGGAAFLSAQLGRPSTCLTSVIDARQAVHLELARRALSPFQGQLCTVPLEGLEELASLLGALSAPVRSIKDDVWVTPL